MVFDNMSTLSKIAIIILVVIVGMGIYSWYYSGDQKTPTVPKKSSQEPINFPQNNDKESKYTLYGFFYPQCGHCKNFLPVWNQLKQSSESPSVNIKTIDATKPENDRLVFYYGVSAYPTVILSTDSHFIHT